MDAERIKVVVSDEEAVEKGQLLGYVNPNYRNNNDELFPHLHFEIRNSPGFDKYSAWQRDAIHPLRVLPYKLYDDSSPLEKVEVGFDSVTDPKTNPVVTLTVVTPRVDVVGVALAIYDKKGEGVYELVEQPGNTPNLKAYYVNPSWFHMEIWNFLYSHKDSPRIPWESFGLNRQYECPYNEEHHPTKYEPNLHLDKHKDGDDTIGDFNGVLIEPAEYKRGITNYRLTLTFKELVGPADCIKAYVSLATGETVKGGEWPTEGEMCPPDEP
ncbi:MAG: hypothetical protein ABFS56_24320 [Pseudomonadota bacterium]